MSRQIHSETDNGGTDSWFMFATRNTGPGDLIWREQSQVTECSLYSERASSGRCDQTVNRSGVTVNKGARMDAHSRLAAARIGQEDLSQSKETTTASEHTGAGVQCHCNGRL